MKSYPIPVVALWFDPNVGAQGYFGAIILQNEEYTPVGLCSKEKWDLGRFDSLRRNWNGNVKIFRGLKILYYSYSVEELLAEGLFEGTPLELKVPDELKEKYFL